MESIKQWNRGTTMESILRKIYAKYVYNGSENTDEVDIFYSNILELVNNAANEYDLEEIESILANLLSEGKIEGKDYNYLINIINDKRKEL